MQCCSFFESEEREERSALLMIYITKIVQIHNQIYFIQIIWTWVYSIMPMKHLIFQWFFRKEAVLPNLIEDVDTGKRDKTTLYEIILIMQKR